ncbi:hypothetical protein H2248_009602 [Termitomyces sp. 'cryptogamus']|nr:hypothetical protein H2248_009602 [Termitomyces sp. 'cryptogamus']
MHRHPKIFRIIHTSCSSSRSAATSARVKPRSLADNPSETTDFSQWAIPSSSVPGSSRASGSQDIRRNLFPTSLRSDTSPITTPQVGMNKWARPTSPQPATRTTARSSPPSNTSSSQSSARSLPSKWASAAPSISQDVTQPSRPDSSPRNNARRHRDAAPHLSSSPGDNTISRNSTKIPDLKRLVKGLGNELPRAVSDIPPQEHPTTIDGVALRQEKTTSRSPPLEKDHKDHHTSQSTSPAQNVEQPSLDSSVHERNKQSSDLRLRSTLIKSDPDHQDQTSRGTERRSNRYDRPERTKRAAFKERGTLLRRDNRDDSRSEIEEPIQKQVNKVKKTVTVERKVSADVYIPSTVSVGTLARLLGVRLEHLQQKMRLSGMGQEAEYDYVLTADYAVLLAEEFGRKPIVNDEAAFDIYPPPPHSDPASLQTRPPVVTIMGHVDHGKTTLLDSLRSTSVAKGEAGGITQHIGAFSVPVPSNSNADGPRSITFLDTPGHAAFSAMRARGARVTDIVVLVVAADDGIMPQTKEVISLIKKDQGKIGVVVAINKVDKPGVNIDAVQKALLAEDMQLEAFGGDIPSVEVSALTGLGLPTLVETLSAIAEMQDLRAEREGIVQGYVLESKVHKGLGPVATVLVLRGCLKTGSYLISGLSTAKVRIMSDATGATVKAAYPGMAITVSGWKTLPNAGDEVLQGSEAEIKKALVNRQRKVDMEATLIDVEAINSVRRQEREKRELELELGESLDENSTEVEEGPKELRLIIKADVSGSAEAVQGALQGIGNKEAITRVISSGVGDISESDVMMAKATGGTIVGFSVKTPKAIETLAAQNGVPIISSDIIYRLMEIVKEKVIALLPVIIETRVTGEAVILQIFDIQLKAKQTKKVAGCRVTNGIIEKSKFARLIRDGVTLHEGSLDTMRILKKDVTEIRKGTECGLCFGPTFRDLRDGDMIQMYEKIEKPGLL